MEPDPKRRKVDEPAAPGARLPGSGGGGPSHPSPIDRSYLHLHPAGGRSPAASPAIPLPSSRGRSRQPSDSTGGAAAPHHGVRAGDTIFIEGYREARVLSVHHDDTVAVRAISTARGDQRVMVKLSLSPTALTAAQFTAEMALLASLHEAGVHNTTKVISREVGRLGTMLVAQDEGSKFFSEIYLNDRGPAPHWTDPKRLLNTIDMAIRLVRLLASIHNLSIVHGSLRPTTLSISVFKEPHIHDFSCAFRAGPDGDANPIRERGMSEESLPFLAPECSGRVGRSADYRSDYYSLGAVLYQVFTGRVPFADTSSDPLEIIHAHIAKRPPLASTIDESIPIPLAQILAKLLEKSPESRYQTSQGLIVDLEKVAQLVRTQSRAPSHLGPVDDADFIVGSVDEAAHFRLPPASKLFGRQHSVDALLACYRRVETLRTSELVVIMGSSGIGKTSLIETVRKPVVKSLGFFTGVKFDQIKSPVPFFAISQALSGLSRQLLSESEDELVVWRKRLSRVLAKEGRVLAEVLPALEHVFQPGWLKSLPPIVVLGPAESEKRFQDLVQRVLRVFARGGRPLVLIFDDLQWSTPADLSFILALLKPEDPHHHHSSPSSLLVICAYRDNEVSPTHIVNTLLLPRLPSVMLTIKLEPLQLADVIAFVSESLRKPIIVVKPGEQALPQWEDASLRGLAELVLQKTLGSPLFVAQLLKSLNNDGFFEFDFAAQRWHYDLDVIASKSLSTDVVELLRAQMLKFSPQGQEYLKIAACIGNEETSTLTLAQAAGKSVIDLVSGLHEAVEAGLLVPIGERKSETYISAEPMTLASLTVPTVPAYYRFFHDRCQQAAYTLIPTTERSAMHYRIGQNLVAATSEGALNDHIFDLSNQLNYGIEILTTVEERDHLARFNYLAGRKANKATAFEASRKYLGIAWDLLGAGGWVGQHELMCQVTEELLEVEFSLADYAASQQYVGLFLAHAKDPVAKLRIYARSLKSATATGDSAHAIEIGREGLAMVGIVLPSEAADGVALARTVRKEIDHDSLIERLEHAPRLTDPIASGVQAILAALVPPVYFTRIDLLGAISALSVRCGYQYGIDDAGAMMLTLQAVMVSGEYKEFHRSYELGQVAIGYFERYGGSTFACPTYKVYASHVAVWSEPIRATLPSFREAVAYGIEYRDGEYLGFGSGELCGTQSISLKFAQPLADPCALTAYSILAGVSLNDVASQLERFSVLVRKFRNELSTLYIGVIHQTTLNFTGRSSHPCEIEGDAFTLDDRATMVEKNYGIIALVFEMFRLMLSTFFHDYPRARSAIRAGREHLAGGAGILYPAQFQLFEAVILFSDPDSQTDEDRVVLSRTMEYFGELAVLQPSNFGHMRLWLQAEEARSLGDLQDAITLYDQAIEAATRAEFVHLAACMNERCAALLPSSKLATGYILEAYALWKTWGCVPKVAAMTLSYPALLGVVSPFQAPRSVGSRSTESIGDKATPVDTAGLDDGTPMEAVETDQHSSSAREEQSSSHTSWLHSGPPRRTSPGSLGSAGHDSSGDQPSFSSSSDPHSRSHLAAELDLRTVVSASSVIGMESTVDGVVSKLLGLALRTAGAELCLLVLDKGGILCAEAIARSDSTEVKHLHRLDSIDVQQERYPCSVINYVARSRTMVVNNLDALGNAISDPYLNKHHPKSILCLALASQSRVIGVLYMENSQTTNAFTPDRLEILSLISGQAASTVERARLVQDLKAANINLTRSQASLESNNRNLEGAVNSRTIQLKDQNARLEAEIAEKERAQAEMRAAKEVAESATAMKSQFLANMSHEIRTPFNAVVALTGLLLDTPLSPVQMDYVETIKNSSHELLVVINDILDYSKIELDHLELSTEKVQLRNALESSMDMVAERAASKSVELALVLEQGDISVVTDLTRLRQIIVNLLSNAVKFTSNGEVIVTCTSEQVDPSPDGETLSRVRISVSDSGIGIAEKDFSKLFRVYSQVDGTETTKLFGGTGLGLAISRKLSLLMGGDITVTSELGEGSTFTLDFVAPSADPPETDLYSPSQNPDLCGKRVLIVDNHSSTRGVLRHLIASFGMSPDAPDDINLAYVVAVEAEDAGKPFDLLIVDSFLPDFAAQTLLRRLRQRGVTTPAIALTRMGSPIHDALRQFDCTFLIKPIKRNRLHHTLRQVFPAGESRKASPLGDTPTSLFPTNLAARNPLVLLCAEDNPINVKVITHLLKRMGYTTDIAEDGLVAVEKVQKKRYDMLFMDVNMPRMNGLEATRRIVELLPDKEARPHIVAMTANAMAGDREACLKAGCDGYVSKPILVPDLVGALTDAGARVRARSAAARPSSAASMSVDLGLPALFELELPVRRSSKKAAPSGSSSNSPARSPTLEHHPD